MPEKISIVFDRSPGLLTREERERGQALLRDLQLNRAFRLICPDGTVRDSFIHILCYPLPKMEETLRRQEAVRLFHDHPALLERLIELVRRLVMSKNSWDAERSRLYASRRVNPNDPGQMLHNGRQSLILACHFLRLFMNLLSEVGTAIDHFGASTGYLATLRNACFDAAVGEDMADLLEFADRCEKNLVNAFSYTMDFTVDETLSTGGFLLSDFRFIRQAPPKKPKQTLFTLLAGKNAPEKAQAHQKLEFVPDPTLNLTAPGVEYGIELSAKAVNECDRYISAMAKALAERFSDLETELFFYKAAVMHMTRLEDRGVTLTFPVILPYEANTLRCEELSDLLLLTESMSVKSVVPNDADFGKSDKTVGLLITGKNNSGKTVYLRSVGCALFLAQCGLPIPAKSAEISLRRRIFTHFAKAEGELTPLSQAGRFEEEAAALAQIIGEIEPYSLLMMNETFQTTAYDEGSEGMYHILRHISALGCGFLFVTHLTKLCELCRGEAILAKTSDDSRTRYKMQFPGGEIG